MIQNEYFVYIYNSDWKFFSDLPRLLELQHFLDYYDTTLSIPVSDINSCIIVF